MAFTKGDGYSELPVTGDIDLAHKGDVAVEGLTELPVHPHVLDKILVTIRRADKTAGGTGKSTACAHGQRSPVTPREQGSLPGNLNRAARIVRPAALQVRRQKGVALE